MMKLTLAVTVFVIATLATLKASTPLAQTADVIPDAGSYVSIPNAAVAPDNARTYRAIYDATRAADDPTQLVPALRMAASGLNAFAVAGVPLRNVKFAVIFHGPALYGILNDANYRAKNGVANPNVKILADLKKAGVEIFVCGQNLAHEKIDPKMISADVTVASAAQIVLMTYQNDGYALMTF